ncbi:MD-2-related lipid-recognition [Nannochloropsis gaditana]|uniref:MD-2-related lipid-recognition n=1 Tax=Nannochloropsis gaditana TaxID=72520 RepID=W7TFU5_9STRA|nr:MD-2-related lipid-recognition [Nannochloropsis gaditana]
MKCATWLIVILFLSKTQTMRAFQTLVSLIVVPCALASPVLFTSCHEDESPLMLESMEINPYPVKAGGTSSVAVTARSTVALEQGSYVEMSFKEGPFMGAVKKYDMCSMSDQDCPIPANSLVKFELDFQINSRASKGVATGNVLVSDHTGAEIACIRVPVQVDH